MGKNERKWGAERWWKGGLVRRRAEVVDDDRKKKRKEDEGPVRPSLMLRKRLFDLWNAFPAFSINAI